jgi:4-hydroxybenzoate polyprenyltransferase
MPASYSLPTAITSVATSTTLKLRRRVGDHVVVIAEKLFAYAVLLRLSTALTGALLAWKVARYWSAHNGLASAIVVAASFGGTFVLNDIVDCKSDAVNTPWRPIPRGAVAVATAGRLAVILFALALTLGIVVGTPLQIAMLVPILLLCVSYSTLWKTVLLGKNAGVAVLTGAVAIYPVVGYARDLTLPIVLGILVAAFMMQKEIVSDVRDVSGDLASGRPTLVISHHVLAVTIVAAANVIILAFCASSLTSLSLFAWAWPWGVVGLAASAAWSLAAVIKKDKSLARTYLYLANAVALCGILAL